MTQIGVHTIQDVRVSADGRVGALVTFIDPDAPTPDDTDSRYVIFVMVGDRWLIAEVIDLEGVGTPTPER